MLYVLKIVIKSNIPSTFYNLQVGHTQISDIRLKGKPGKQSQCSEAEVTSPKSVTTQTCAVQMNRNQNPTLSNKSITRMWHGLGSACYSFLKRCVQ